jgi:hypothetical protein
MFKKATRPSTPGVRSNIQTTAPILRQGEVEQKRKKKGVTWADQIPQPIPSKEFPLQEATAAIGTHGNLVPMKADAGIVDAVVLEDYTDLAGLVEISETTESGRMQTSQPASTADGTEQCTSVSFVDESASSLARFRLSSISTQASGSDAIEDASGTWVEEPINQSSSHEIAGWDSDLTELTESQEEAESQDGSSETEVNDVRWEKTICLLFFPSYTYLPISQDRPPSVPSGLKIRIPARPAGAYSRKCASPKCSQLLSVGYRWKSCVLCRARSRDYQRQRQNLQGKHLRLDQELLDEENTGTPLAGVREFLYCRCQLFDCSYRTSLLGFQN